MYQIINIDDDEYVQLTTSESHNSICLEVGSNDDEDAGYGLFMDIREARRVVSALHDCIRDITKREGKKHENL